MKPFVLGITGPTGSGKSAVSELLRRAGFAVIDADKVAREVMEPPSPLLPILEQEFGPGILRRDGSLDRKALAARAFSSKESANRLSALTHPAIMKEISRLLREYAGQSFPRILIDAPLLYESGGDRLCDAVLAVVAKDSVRLKRIMQRDSLSEDAARARMGSQQSCEEYAARADYVIENNAGERELAGAVEHLLESLTGKEAAPH